MNISQGFIKRPIATSLIMLGIAFFGVLAYIALPVADLPSVEFPTISVSAALPGADPGTMASAVASPLERQFTTIAGLNSISSNSGTGSSSITLQFDLSRDIDSAAVDVQTAIAAAMPLLPAGMPAPPAFAKVNPADAPVISISPLTQVLKRSDLHDYAEEFINPKLSMLKGVAQVSMSQAGRFAVRVQLDPERLRAHQIGINEVEDAIQNWNVNLPTGQLFGRSSTFNINTDGQLMGADQYRPIIVAYRNGAPIRLEQVANVIESMEDLHHLSWIYTKDRRELGGGTIRVQRQPGANIIQIADDVRRVLGPIMDELPPSMRLRVLNDQSEAIRKAFADVRWTMLVTLVLVVAVIFLFLHNASATIIQILALPVSLLGTFAVMKLLNFSLNNLSMMALVLSIGFVVDDAIVVLENIVRHMEKGEGPVDAALNGSREIGFTIVTMTTSLAAVFIPILFMTGILGRLFREFAVTITVAVIISGIVSVTLTPMLCSRFLRVTALHAKSGFTGWLERSFDVVLRGYARSLTFVLRHRPAMLAAFAIVIIATVQMFRIVPKGFIPEPDNDEMSVAIRAAQGISYWDISEITYRIASIIQKNPNVLDQHVDVQQASAGRQGITVQLVPREERDATAAEVAAQIRPLISNIPNVRTTVSIPPAFQIGAGGGSTYRFVLQSPSTDELYAWAPRLEAALSDTPELLDVSSDLDLKSPRVNLVIDRDKTASLGLNVAEIQSALHGGFGPRWVSTMYARNAQYRVMLEIDPNLQQSVDALKKISFKTPDGVLVPLESIIRFQDTVGPMSIRHFGQLPAVTMSFGLKPGISLGEGTERVRQVARELLPATMTTNFEGSAQVFEQSMTNLTVLMIVAIGIVYIVLGALYESYIHPLTVLSGLPAAGLGALVTLWAFGSELNVYSFVGLIMLIGIVEKNAIMQIDFALDAERQTGKTPAEAIYEGCVIRFRPIMMTTMVAICAALPIALGYGAGGEARSPLGLAVLGGLLVSQTITLYLTPVVYTYLAALSPASRTVATRSAATPATA